MKQGEFTETSTRNFYFLYFVSRKIPKYNNQKEKKKESLNY